MKKHFLLLALLLCGFLYNTTSAQGLQVNISLQPVWGPVGFDHADYYYFPDIEAYYDVPQHQFVYREGGNWVFAAALPPRFGHFDLYHAYKVVINEPKPYLHHDIYLKKYAAYKGRHDQPVIRDSHDQKYYVIKDHPDHNKYKGEEHHDERDRH
jgi:hypothetical protein